METHTHHMFMYPHHRPLLPPTSSRIFTHAKAEWVFLRSAIIPSAECRQQNYLVGTPSTPIPHSLHTLSHWEIKQNHLDRSGTNTSKPFVCHTWGPQMDSHHTVEVDWKCMLIYTSLPLFPNVAVVLPAAKWPCICPCCPHYADLPSPHHRHDVMSSNNPSHITQCWLFEMAHAPNAYLIHISITVELWLNYAFFFVLYYCKRFVTLETECNMQFISVHAVHQVLP